MKYYSTFKNQKRSTKEQTSPSIESNLKWQNNSFKKEKMSTGSPIKASIDFASNSIQNIKIKQYNFDSSNTQNVSPKIPSIDHNEDSADVVSTFSSHEFKEVIDNTIHEAAIRSKRAKEAIKNSIEKNIIFENDTLNQNLNLSFLPLIEKQKFQIRDKSVGNVELPTTLNARSMRMRSINHRNKNASMMNARKSDIIFKFGGTISNRKEKQSDAPNRYHQLSDSEHLAPKPIKDPRYQKIEKGIQTHENSFKIDHSIQIEKSNNFDRNCPSPIFKPASNWMKKFSKQKKGIKNKITPKQPIFNSLDGNIELEGRKKVMEAAQKNH